MAIAGGSALLGAAAALLAMAAAGGAERRDRAEIETIVREYILAHPEILPQAMENLRAKEFAKAIDENRIRIETPFKSSWEGNPNGDVILVEFFDYACGYCRASLPDIERLLSEDKNLKIVYREMPVLGQASYDAALISLAAAEQGKYAAFHKALFKLGRPSDATITQAMKAAKMDEKAARAFAKSKDVGEALAQSREIQTGLQMSGTPTWIVGDKLLGGAVGYDALKSAIAEARAAKKAG